MKRREFIVGLGGATGRPLATRAQQSNQIRRIGVLAGNADIEIARASSRFEIAARIGLVRGPQCPVRHPLARAQPATHRRETADLIATDPAVIVSGTSIAIVLNPTHITRDSRRVRRHHRSGRPRLGRKLGASRRQRHRLRRLRSFAGRKMARQNAQKRCRTRRRMKPAAAKQGVLLGEQWRSDSTRTRAAHFRTVLPRARR